MDDTLCKRIEHRWKTWWFSISGWLPMLRRTHRKSQGVLAAITARNFKYNRERCDREIADNKKVLDAIVAKSVRTTWHPAPDSPGYVLSILMNPEQFGGLRYGVDELRYLAKHIGYTVEMEVATAKFIEKARDSRRQRSLRDPNSFE